MTELSGFMELLRDVIGLDAASIGEPAIERAVQEQRAACRMSDLAAYHDHLRSSPAAVQALVEAVVVPETWFFRDREAFAALAHMAREEWPRIRPDRVLRLLSLPCSTGEEPYSMAMALLDAGLPPERFLIDAVDVSARALRVAERAVYGRNSFRGADLAFRDGHFTDTGEGAWLDAAARRQVRFHRGNLFAPGLLSGMVPYDAIFCRNLLIYFDRETQDRSIGVLQRLMADDTALFVGPSETALLLDHGFASLRIPLAFVFRKGPPPPVRPAVPPRPAQRPLPPIRPPSPRPVAKRPRPPAPPPVPDIEEAVRLADQGRLAEAAMACAAHTRRHGASAGACYLMGLIRDAAGDQPEAEREYRKALYLDQDHQEALTHLALLLERRGELAAARLLRNRAARVSAR